MSANILIVFSGFMACFPLSDSGSSKEQASRHNSLILYKKKNLICIYRAFLDHSWKYFVAVNRCVADVIIKDYKRGDTVWVHDYHLLLVPKMVREALGPEAKIGFFLHVAFPSSEIFRCLAHRQQLLEGMLGASLIGFQTEEYTRHFLQTCSRLLCVEAKNDGLELDDRFVDVISLPIGINPAQLEEKRKEEKVQEWLGTLKTRYAGKKLFVARDKVSSPRWWSGTILGTYF